MIWLTKWPPSRLSTGFFELKKTLKKKLIILARCGWLELWLLKTLIWVQVRAWWGLSRVQNSFQNSNSKGFKLQFAPVSHAVYRMSTLHNRTPVRSWQLSSAAPPGLPFLFQCLDVNTGGAAEESRRLRAWVQLQSVNTRKRTGTHAINWTLEWGGMAALGKNPPKPFFLLNVSRRERAFACRICVRGPLKLYVETVEFN